MIKILVTIMLVLIACQAQEEPAAQTLRIATDPTAPPFEFLQDGSPTGLDLEFLAAVAAAAGNLNYEIVQLSWADLFAQVAASQVDLAISGITINDERRQTYDFSVPYFLSTHMILIKEGTNISSAQDLIGKRVAVRDATTGLVAVEKILGADNPNILKYPDQNQAIQAVIDNQADAYVEDNALLEYYKKNNPGFAVIPDDNAFAKEFYGLMFPKGSDLVATFNQGITIVLENGQYAAIYEKWLGSVPDVALLLEAGEDEDPYDVFESENLEGGNEEEGEIGWDGMI